MKWNGVHISNAFGGNPNFFTRRCLRTYFSLNGLGAWLCTVCLQPQIFLSQVLDSHPRDFHRVSESISYFIIETFSSESLSKLFELKLPEVNLWPRRHTVTSGSQTSQSQRECHEWLIPLHQPGLLPTGPISSGRVRRRSRRGWCSGSGYRMQLCAFGHRPARNSAVWTWKYLLYLWHRASGK